MKYIVADNNSNYVVEDSLEKAFKSYKLDIDDGIDQEELLVFEVELIEVEFKVVKKTKPVKVINKVEK